MVFMDFMGKSWRYGGITRPDIIFNIIYIGQGYDTESIENMGECYGDFWRKVNQNQQYTACC